MDYKAEIKECYASIMENEQLTVNMEISMGFNMRTVYQTLDVLKIIMVYAWEKYEYGTYKDFFHGKELVDKYLNIIQYPDEVILCDFKKYLKKFHVRTIFDDNIEILEKMEKIIGSLG